MGHHKILLQRMGILLLFSIFFLTFFNLNRAPNLSILAIGFPLTSTASGNPESPDLLTDGVVVLEEYYNSDYYYKTGDATAEYVQLFWVNPTATYNTLAIYSDAAFSNPLVGGQGFVLIRPTSTQPLYPKVHSTVYISAYIMWEIIDAPLTIGTPIIGTLSTANYVEGFLIPLENTRYNISLVVPETGDFDWYLYYLQPGDASNGAGHMFRSENERGVGVDEIAVNYRPSETGDCILLLVCYSGSGQYNLTVTSNQSAGSIPFTPPLLLLGILSIIILGVLTLEKQVRRV